MKHTKSNLSGMADAECNVVISENSCIEITVEPIHAGGGKASAGDPVEIKQIYGEDGRKVPEHLLGWWTCVRIEGNGNLRLRRYQ